MEAEPFDEIELMHRRSAGIEVFLMWHKATNLVSLVYADDEAKTSQQVIIPNDQAMEAFAHPRLFLPSSEAA